jgi:hypothetical protein
MVPFEDDEGDLSDVKRSAKKPKISDGKSLFDNQPKQPSTSDFLNRASEINGKMNDYKSRAAELAAQFKKMISDKTLPQNKTVISRDIEREVLVKMMQLASEINNDENEEEGMGSLGWIALLFNTSVSNRDRCNVMEYELLNIKNEINSIRQQLSDVKK